MYLTLIYGIIAGIVGTLIGGLIAVKLGKANGKMTAILTAVAGGAMLTVVFFELIPDAFENAGGVVVIISLIAGIAIMLLLGYLTDKVAFFAGGKAYTVAIAIALHNFPEGLVVGSAGSISGGLLLVLLIMAHNIPEGIVLALPVYKASGSKVKAVLATALSGSPTVLGALTGYAMAQISQVMIAFSLAFAAGAMLAVIYREMMPACYSYGDDTPSIVMLFSIVGGLIFIVLLGA